VAVSRRAAQRATAARVRAARQPGGRYEKILPTTFREPSIKAQHNYANAVLEGREPAPAPGSLESKLLARLAGRARWNKEDPKYLEFQKYWYHKKDEKNEADIEDEADYEDEEDDEE
jgi:hypothetical protein